MNNLKLTAAILMSIATLGQSAPLFSHHDKQVDELLAQMTLATVSPCEIRPRSSSFFKPLSIVFCGWMKSNSITNGVTPQLSVSSFAERSLSHIA